MMPMNCSPVCTLHDKFLWILYSFLERLKYFSLDIVKTERLCYIEYKCCRVAKKVENRCGFWEGLGRDLLRQ